MAFRIPVPRGIRAQLVALVLAVALPAAGLVGYNMVEAANEARQAAYGQVRVVAQEVAARFDLVLRDHEALLARLAVRPRIKALDPTNCDPIIAEFASVRPEYTTLGLRDRDANAVCTFLRPPLGAERVRAYPWFDAGLRHGQLMVGDAFLGPQSRRWVLPLTHPVKDAAGNVAGLLLMTLDLAALQQRVFGTLPEETIVVVVDRGNKYLMRSIQPAEWIGKPLPRAQLDRLPDRIEEVFELSGVDGVTRLNAGALVAASGWRVYAGLPKDLVLAAHEARLARSVAVGIVVLLSVLGLAYRIGSAIAGPIDELARSAAELAPGGSAARASGEGAVEIQAAAGGLRRLAEERERQRGERAALAAHYDQLIRMARDIVLLIDPAGYIVEANDAAVSAYGYGADELRGMQERALYPPQAQATAEQNWRDSARAQGVLFETVHRRKDGSTFPVEISARAIEVAGKLYRQSFVRDIGERKRAEAALRESQETLGLFIQYAPSAIAMFDRDMRYIAFSRRWLADYGLGEQDLTGRSHYEVFPDLPERWREIHRRCLAGATEICDEDPFPRADGSVDWVRWEVHPWRSGAGDIGGIIIFSEVITERKRAEEERGQIFERITDAFVALDKDWRYTFVNPKAAQMFGRRAEDLIGKHIWTEFPEGVGQPFHLAYEKAMAEQQPAFLEEYYPPFDRWFENRIYPSPEGLSIYFHDITERKQAENEVRRLHEELQRHAADLEQRVVERTSQLEAAKIRAESADRVKSAFLATMSHELRTPLNSIIGFTGILLQKLPGPLNAEQEKQLDIVRNASRHLLALINDVLDISKVEAGELTLSREAFDLRALLDRLGAAFAPQAARRGLDFSLDIGQGEAGVTGDARRVEQVLNNLLSNALKFTPEGKITLTLARDGSAFVIAVADTGVGIKPEDMDKLFRPFSQIETGLPELREGTGLGLAISLHLAQAMGGQIAAESAWGKGSRFAFTLPAGGKA